MKDAASFCELFCKTFECSPEDFDQKVFWRSIYPRAVPLARLIWQMDRDFFAQDLKLIAQVKLLTRSNEVALEIERYRYHRRASGFLRGLLKVRISGRRLLDLAGRLFAEAGLNARPEQVSTKRGCN